MVSSKLIQLQTRKLSAVENIRNFLSAIERDNKKLNIFLHVNTNAIAEAERVDKKIRNGEAGKLAGLGIAVKSNINVAEMPISCASNTLKNYLGTYDADVIRRIKEEDGIILGMVNMDEFACGSSGETSAFGPCQNPSALGLIPGGSSSGSAASVAAGMCDIALGSDTGGSIRNPASHCGVVGIKPSYGRVSRYGLIDLSMTLDQIGPLSRDVFGSALMMQVISGKSEKDAITFDETVPEYSSEMKKGIKKIKIGISPIFKKLCTNPHIYSLIENGTEKLTRETDSEVVEIDLKHVDLAIQAYYPIVYVEFYSGTRRFDGRKYGKKIEEASGEEVLRRILGGREISRAEHHGAYYRKALAAKNLISKDFENAFEKVDVIAMPTVPSLPHKIGTEISTKEMYAYDAFTIPANLAGVCAGVQPAGELREIPIGIQFMAPAFREDLLFRTMHAFELSRS